MQYSDLEEMFYLLKYKMAPMANNRIRIFFICFMILLTINLYKKLDFVSAQDPTYEEEIIATILINNFSTNCALDAEVNFTIKSNYQSTFVLFLPSSKGPAWILNSTMQIKENVFEYNYNESKFEGKCFTHGFLFPLDYYELVFIIGFDNNFSEINNGEKLFATYGDRLLYSNWYLRNTTKKADYNEVLNHVDHIAPSKDQLTSLIKNNQLSEFYIFTVTIGRLEPFIISSLFLCIPPILIIFIYIGLFINEKKKEVLIKKNKKISLYTGTAFFLSAYLITLRAYLPPILTIIEFITICGIIIPLLMLEFEFIKLINRLKGTIVNLAKKTKGNLSRFKAWLLNN